jgi:hypothetical protein
VPEPLFLLCSPQSQGSLICAMLGRHPDCYGLPQLNLFIADRLGTAWDALAGHPPGGRDGLLRAVAEVNDGKQTDETIGNAKGWIEARRHWRVRQVFEHIEAHVAPRVMVEYSATTAQSLDHIERMYANFPRANFLHVIRHPRNIARAVTADAQGDADAAWHGVQQNVIDFGGLLPAGQIMTIRTEDLGADPELYLPQIALWLGIDRKPAAIEAMLHPEKSRFAKPGPAGAAAGSDADFLAAPKLDRKTLSGGETHGITGELEWKQDAMFSKPTQKIARQLGYL